MVTTNGSVSFWWDAIGRPQPRPTLPGSLRADVCIVGGGYTGLWTAYYLKKAAPALRIVLLDKNFSGFGASGRNGGWLTNSITGGREQYLASHGREAVRRFQTAMNNTVDEVIRIAARAASSPSHETPHSRPGCWQPSHQNRCGTTPTCCCCPPARLPRGSE